MDNKPITREEKSKIIAERKKQDKAISGDVKVKKKSETSSIKDVFISEDIHNVKSFILMDVLVPAAKKAITDIIVNGLDMVLYGGKGNLTRRSPADRVTYSRFYDSGRQTRPAANEYRSTRQRYNYDEIIFETANEAETILDRMDEVLDKYHMVSVADLYEFAGLTPEHTDNKYGWTNIRSAHPVRVREGYVIKFPMVQPLD